jgi:hypothetical protein
MNEITTKVCTECVRFEVVTVLKMAFFWVVMPSGLTGRG